MAVHFCGSRLFALCVDGCATHERDPAEQYVNWRGERVVATAVLVLFTNLSPLSRSGRKKREICLYYSVSLNSKVYN